MDEESVRVSIVYPTDPFAPIPGGTDTCIRDILAHAPADIAISLIGVTADVVARPVRRWTECRLAGRTVRVFPVLQVTDLRRQQRVPLSAQFTAALLRRIPDDQAEILQFHRIEPMLAYWWDKRAKISFVHQNMSVIRNRHSDIRWKYLPFVYEWFESRCVEQIAQLYCVREDAVLEYQKRYPNKATVINFLPTWMDPETFSPVGRDEKLSRRQALFAEEHINWAIDDDICVFVGRLDHQKNPLLLIRALARAAIERPKVRLLVIGDGILRQDVEALIDELSIRNRVVLTGVLPRERVAEFLRCSDVKLLSSGYEGMPRCVVEALGSGIPAVATRVGEVPRLIEDGASGITVDDHTPEAFAAGIVKALIALPNMSAELCLAAVEQFTPRTVLESVYDSYRRIHRDNPSPD